MSAGRATVGHSVELTCHNSLMLGLVFRTKVVFKQRPPCGSNTPRKLEMKSSSAVAVGASFPRCRGSGLTCSERRRQRRFDSLFQARFGKPACRPKIPVPTYSISAESRIRRPVFLAQTTAAQLLRPLTLHQFGSADPACMPRCIESLGWQRNNRPADNHDPSWFWSARRCLLGHQRWRVRHGG